MPVGLPREVVVFCFPLVAHLSLSPPSRGAFLVSKIWDVWVCLPPHGLTSARHIARIHTSAHSIAMHMFIAHVHCGGDGQRHPSAHKHMQGCTYPRVHKRCVSTYAHKPSRISLRKHTRTHAQKDCTFDQRMLCTAGTVANAVRKPDALHQPGKECIPDCSGLH